MSRVRSFERHARISAFVLSCLLYALAAWFFRLWTENLPDTASPSFSVNSVNLSFTQIKLQAAVEAPPPEPKPEPEPEPLEEVDVVLEEIIEEPEPEPEPDPEPIPVEAQMTQAAATMEPYRESEHLGIWVSGLVEQVKYYPATAQRAGMTGTFDLLIKVGKDGVISEVTIASGKGSALLRRALSKMIRSLPGKYFGRPIEEAVDLSLPVDFELN